MEDKEPFVVVRVNPSSAMSFRTLVFDVLLGLAKRTMAGRDEGSYALPTASMTCAIPLEEFSRDGELACCSRGAV